MSGRARTLGISGATLAALVLAAPTIARADQCAWLDDASLARRATRLLAASSSAVAYCEPCGDRAPGAPFDPGAVVHRELGAGHHEVTLDGTTIDLAYLYLRRVDRYVNLAHLVGCPTEGVTPSLEIFPASTGVVIRADGGELRLAPGLATAPLGLAPAPPPPGATSAPAPTIVVIASPPLEWFAIGAGWMAALVVAGLWLAGRRPRRAAALPRATELIDRAQQPPPSA